MEQSLWRIERAGRRWSVDEVWAMYALTPAKIAAVAALDR
jgi:hypothetical protein